MDKEKAIAKAEAFKDDWEIDRLEGTAYHKPTGFKLSLGAVWRDEKGERQFEVLHWYEKNIPEAKQDMKEVNRLLKEFGILYEAGYMPPLTKEEIEEEYRKIDEAVAKSRAWHEARVAAEEEWQRTHPEEYIEQSENNIRKYYAKAQAANEKWYKDRGMEFPEERKKYYEQETQKMIEKFHKEYLNKDLGR